MKGLVGGEVESLSFVTISTELRDAMLAYKAALVAATKAKKNFDRTQALGHGRATTKAQNTLARAQRQLLLLVVAEP